VPAEKEVAMFITNLIHITSGRAACFACVLLGVLAPFASTFGAPGDTTVIAGSGYSGSRRALSADGRFVLFNGYGGLTVRDRETGTEQRVDVSSDGTAAEGAQHEALSANGRYMAFIAGNGLTPKDINERYDVYMHDRYARVTELISGDATGTAVGGDSPSISADGRFVAFTSNSPDLVPNDTNGAGDVFVRDRQLGVIERVSVASSGAQTDAWCNSTGISDDGRYVAMQCGGSSLVADDTNAQLDVFVHDRVSGATERASIDPSGAQRFAPSFLGSISGNGRYIAFFGQYTGGVFVYDRILRRSELVSVGANGPAHRQSFQPSISFDGRFVAFMSYAANLVASDLNGFADVFVRDRLNKRTSRVSVSTTGAEGNNQSEAPAISGDGRFVVFTSYATNLVPEDSGDVFIYEQKVSAFALKPSALAFGYQALSMSTQLSFWLTNKGVVPLPLASVSVVGLNKGMFTVVNRCGSSVTAATSCQLRITFRPTTVGAKTASLRVVAGDNDIRTHGLTGTGVVSPFAVSPTAIEFGSVPINTATDARIITLTNTANSPLPIAAIGTQSIYSGQFSLNHNCPATLNPGGGCTLSVAFGPTVKGSIAAFVNIVTAGGAATRSVALLGSGR
jgi:hypothetical protein